MRDYLPSLWTGFEPMARVNDIFREFFSDFPSLKEDKVLSPAFDIKETDEAYILKGELPGVKVDDINIDVDNDVLTISGEKKEDSKEEGKGYWKVERSYGTFRRRFSLTSVMDSENIDASFKDGVLTLTLPKLKKSNSKSVEIKTE